MDRAQHFVTESNFFSPLFFSRSANSRFEIQETPLEPNEESEVEEGVTAKESVSVGRQSVNRNHPPNGLLEYRQPHGMLHLLAQGGSGRQKGL